MTDRKVLENGYRGVPEGGRVPSAPGSRPSDHAPAGHGVQRIDPSRVVDYINAASVDGVIAEYATNYAEDGWANRETWEKFKGVLNDKIGVQRTDNMRVLITHYEAGDWGDARFDVGGADDEESNWSLSFTPWGEWKLLCVEDATGKSLTVDQIAAHLFYEICWYGWEDAAESVRDNVLDAKEAVERGLVEVVPLFPRDSDGSGEAIETPKSGSTEGDSAGPKDIAQPSSPSDHQGERA